MDSVRRPWHNASRTAFITVVIYGMAIARSKITAQGQISVPAEVRRKLGLGPGSTIEWDEQDDHIVVRRAGTLTSEEIHRRLFPDAPPARRTFAEIDEGIRQHMRKKHARR